MDGDFLGSRISSANLCFIQAFDEICTARFLTQPAWKPGCLYSITSWRGYLIGQNNLTIYFLLSHEFNSLEGGNKVVRVMLQHAHKWIFPWPRRESQTDVASPDSYENAKKSARWVNLLNGKSEPSAILQSEKISWQRLLCRGRLILYPHEIGHPHFSQKAVNRWLLAVTILQIMFFILAFSSGFSLDLKTRKPRWFGKDYCVEGN